MPKEANFKIVFKEDNIEAFQVVFKGKISDYKTYELIKKSIYNSPSFSKLKIKKEDKFILQIENCPFGDIKSIWDEDTYQYFYNKVLNSNEEKSIKLKIIKVVDYPIWNPPKKMELLKNLLEMKYHEIKNELIEKLDESNLDNGNKVYIQNKLETQLMLENEEIMFDKVHYNIVCNNCFSSNFIGMRYICSECINYNLCYHCYTNSKSFHNPEHTFILLNRPLYINISNYNSSFFPNRIIKTVKKEPFELEVNIINIGENNLQYCFLSPIRFGKEYLGCLKQTISEEAKKGEKIKLNIFIIFDDIDEDEDQNDINLLDYYEGYFRLMTKEGIPFGDILYIKLNIDKS